MYIVQDVHINTAPVPRACVYVYVFIYVRMCVWIYAFVCVYICNESARMYQKMYHQV